MNDKWLDFAIRIQSIGCTLLYPQRRLESRKHMKKNDDIIAFGWAKCPILRKRDITAIGIRLIRDWKFEFWSLFLYLQICNKV